MNSDLPIIFQRLEGVAIFIAAIWLYAASGGGWMWLGLLFFSFDLSFLGYLAGNNVGAHSYNIFHSMIAPSILLPIGLAYNHNIFLFTLIWFGHIGFDRALGYGLKYTSGFSHTHLGMIGKRQG